MKTILVLDLLTIFGRFELLVAVPRRFAERICELTSRTLLQTVGGN